MKSLELFSGAGGLAKGLEYAGFEHAMFVEFNRHACNSLKMNFNPDSVFCGDIRDFDFSQTEGIDLVVGGPPCQPFSMAGKHKANEDNRDMFPYAAKAVSYHRPKAFLFENVKGLLRPTFAEYFSYIILRMTFPEIVLKEAETWQSHHKRLKEINWEKYSGVKYKVKYSLLNAADYGVPQIRERVFIVGLRSDLNVEWVFPKKTHSSDALYHDQFVSRAYWLRHEIRPLEKPSRDYPRYKKIARLKLPLETPLQAWRTVRDALQGVPHPEDGHSISDHIFRDGARSYAGHTGSYIDLPAKTLKAGGHGVPGGENMIRHEDGKLRYFTVFESKLLQTFPPDFTVTGTWGEAMRQIGNAVPTMLAKTLGNQLMSLLMAAETRSDTQKKAKDTATLVAAA